MKKVENLLPIIERNYAFGIYRGKVEYNKDPLSLGRIKVRVLQFHGDYSCTTTEDLPWAYPCFPFGTFTIPEVGDYVWVMFEGGSLEHPVYIGQWYPLDPNAGYTAPIETIKSCQQDVKDKVYKTDKGGSLSLIDQTDFENVSLKSQTGNTFFMSGVQESIARLVEILAKDGYFRVDEDRISIGFGEVSIEIRKDKVMIFCGKACLLLDRNGKVLMSK